MKKIFSLTTICVAVLFAGNASAKTWYYDVLNAPATQRYSTSGTVNDGKGLWYDSEGAYINGALPSEADDLVLGLGTGATATKKIEIDQDNLVFNSLTFNATVESNNKYIVNLQAVTGANSLTINGNVNHILQSDLNISGFALHIKGNFEGQTLGCSINLGGKSLQIDGDLKGCGFFNLSGTAASTFENPNVVIKGVVSHKDARLFLATSGANSYYRIGGLSGSDARVVRNVSSLGTSNLILTNTTDQVYGANSTIADYNRGTYPVAEPAKFGVYNSNMGNLRLVMDGTATQTIQSIATFSGGVQMVSGTLKMRFAQRTDQYTYWEDSGKTKLITFWTKNAGAGVQTTFSHGDLIMQGGTFANEGGSTTYGSFRFTNIEYKGGVISLRMTSATQWDFIDLTGYYKKTVEAGQDDAYTYVNGGTIKLAADAVAGTKVTFDFADTENFLIDCEENGGLGMKIVAWDASNKTQLSEKDFYAKGITKVDDYEAKFTITDDGLYVKYVQAVPEPATLAAFFGALALGFAAWRRRK